MEKKRVATCSRPEPGDKWSKRPRLAWRGDSYNGRWLCSRRPPVETPSLLYIVPCLLPSWKATAVSPKWLGSLPSCFSFPEPSHLFPYLSLPRVLPLLHDAPAEGTRNVPRHCMWGMRKKKKKRKEYGVVTGIHRSLFRKCHMDKRE